MLKEPILEQILQPETTRIFTYAIVCKQSGSQKDTENYPNGIMIINGIMGSLTMVIHEWFTGTGNLRTVSKVGMPDVLRDFRRLWDY